MKLLTEMIIGWLHGNTISPRNLYEAAVQSLVQ